jgi:hypothetical protein
LKSEFGIKRIKDELFGTTPVCCHNAFFLFKSVVFWCSALEMGHYRVRIIGS